MAAGHPIASPIPPRGSPLPAQSDPSAVRRLAPWLLAFLLQVAALPAPAGQALASLRHFYATVETYHARFRQTVLDEGLNLIQETSGELWIKRPGLFRWEYDPPYRQTIVGDGERVWVYDHDLEQITVRKADRALGDTPALLLAGRGDLERDFTLEELGRQGKLDWVRMVPRNKDGGYEDIRIGFAGKRLVTLELVDGLGQVTRIHLSDQAEGGAPPAGTFRFEPPPGIDILREEE